MPVRSLTQTEARQRASLLTVARYEVEVDLTALPDGPALRSVSTGRFTCDEQGASSFVDCATEVVSATLDGAPLPPAVDGRIALPLLGGEHVLRVEAVQVRTADGQGVHRAVDPADGEVYTVLLFPVHGVGGEFVNRGEGAAPVVAKSLRERADLMRRVLRSRG